MKAAEAELTPRREVASPPSEVLVFFHVNSRSESLTGGRVGNVFESSEMVLLTGICSRLPGYMNNPNQAAGFQHLKTLMAFSGSYQRRPRLRYPNREANLDLYLAVQSPGFPH